MQQISILYKKQVVTLERIGEYLPGAVPNFNKSICSDSRLKMDRSALTQIYVKKGTGTGGDPHRCHQPHRYPDGNLLLLRESLLRIEMWPVRDRGQVPLLGVQAPGVPDGLGVHAMRLVRMPRMQGMRLQRTEATFPGGKNGSQAGPASDCGKFRGSNPRARDIDRSSENQFENR